jgi:hypothetical protein
LIDIRHAAFLAYGAHGAVLHRHTEEFQLAHVYVDAFHAEDSAQNQTAVEHTDGQTIGFRAAVDVLRGNEGASARHIFDDERRISRNMFAHMARHGASVDIKSTAWAAADDDTNGLAFVKVFRRTEFRRQQIKRHR